PGPVRVRQPADGRRHAGGDERGRRADRGASVHHRNVARLERLPGRDRVAGPQVDRSTGQRVWRERLRQGREPARVLHHRPHRNLGSLMNARGFTLIELLVAMTLAVLLLGAVALVFAGTSLNRGDLERSARLSDNAHYTLDVLTDEFQ